MAKIQKHFQKLQEKATSKQNSEHSTPSSGLEFSVPAVPHYPPRGEPPARESVRQLQKQFLGVVGFAPAVHFPLTHFLIPTMISIPACHPYCSRHARPRLDLVTG